MRRVELKTRKHHDDRSSVALRALKLRWAGTCVTCGSVLPAGTPAWWDPTTKRVTCTRCRTHEAGGATTSVAPIQLDRGRAGASVGREYQRRRHNRESRTLQAHPRIGPLLLALSNAPRHEKAFRLGELGERAVADTLERLTAGAAVLHDRRMPGGYGNIDHLAIVRSGVFVIDAKGYKGKVKVLTPLFGPQRLLIAGRERTKLIDGLERQVTAVREALAANGHPGVPVRGVLCFTTADLPFFGTLKIRGHLLLHRRSLLKKLRGEGPLGPQAIEVLTHTLARALPPA
jgi:hypothetical protein